MKKLLAGMVVAALVLVGCESKPAGGPGATPSGSTSGHKPDGTHADKHDTFTVKEPSTVDIKQGETKDVHVAINRKKEFTQKVDLTFEAPKGITVEPAKTFIPADKDDVVVKVKAGDDAAIGDAVINFKAQPESGTALQSTMKVKVDKATK